MTTLIETLKSHEKAICLGSLAVLTGYLLSRTWIWPQLKLEAKHNKLDVSLKNLVANCKHANITKIVVTESVESSGILRNQVIDQLREELNERQIKMLVNCSPQKLLRAGCECFLLSMEQNDHEYLEYYHNAVKTQFLIEDTIANIELINESSGPIVMVCDSNCMDVKTINPSVAIWDNFLAKYDIQESALRDNYDLVIHLTEENYNKIDENMIEDAWKGFPEYHRFSYDENQEPAQRVEQVMKVIRTFLAKQKQDQPLLMS